MLEPRIQQHFYDTADVLVQAAEPLTRPLVAATELVLTAVTGGGKLLFTGSGAAQADALYATALFMGGAERHRPGLPALTLGADPAVVAALSQAEGASSTDLMALLARQVHALGLPGDVLVVFEAPSSLGAPPSLAPLVTAAHDRELSVVLWTASPREAPVSPSAELLTDIDVHIPVRADRLAQSSTLYRLGWLALMDALDLQLLGETE
ncbi:MAG: SIS domain-containing protein [Burkholderiaceae bacterium]|jgi:D-sedoheptulose 7-phosphate isomerase